MSTGNGNSSNQSSPSAEPGPGGARPAAAPTAKPDEKTSDVGLRWTGIVVAVAGVIVFIYVIFQLFTVGAKTASPPNAEFNFVRDVIGQNFNLIAYAIIGAIFALFSIRLLAHAGLLSLAGQVIRREDKDLLWPLVAAANKDAISQYIRLASLSGFPGTFTKLGFTGLPLVTVALTLILLAIAALTEGDMQKSVFDMAKLTLGAFLGSFVQRNIEQEKLAGHVIGPITTGTGDGRLKPGTKPSGPAGRKKVDQ